MGTLTKLPSLAIIDGFKGKIDFYVYMDIPCFRKWPKKIGQQRSPAVSAQWPAFTYASKSWNELSAIVQDAYKATAAGTYLSGRDLFVKSFITDYFREGQWT